MAAFSKFSVIIPNCQKGKSTGLLKQQSAPSSLLRPGANEGGASSQPRLSTNLAMLAEKEEPKLLIKEGYSADASATEASATDASAKRSEENILDIIAQISKDNDDNSDTNAEQSPIEPAEAEKMCTLSEVDNESEDEDYLAESETEEEVVDLILKKHKITNSSWMMSRDQLSMLVTFVVESGRKEEDVLDDLLTKGIGKKLNTSVCISPVSVCFGPEFGKKKKVKKVHTVKSEKSMQSSASSKNIASALPLSELQVSPVASVTASASVACDMSTISRTPSPADDTEKTQLLTGIPEPTVSDEAAKLDAESVAETEDAMESDFVKSRKSRIIIQPVVAGLKRNADFTFDYLMFVILASIISGVGLVENNSVILVASMVISPLMGPILAGTFGAAVKDPALRNTGIKSELIGLGICILTGFILGLPVVFIKSSGGWVLSSASWPPAEMFGRGLPRNLLVGAVIALATGSALALSILGDNHKSLVGVAISASLLCPAVNTGLLWALSFQAAVYPPEYKIDSPTSTVFPSLNNTANSTDSLPTKEPVGESTSLICPEIVGNDFVPTFTCNLAQEAFILGSVSLCRTLVNIVLIVVSAMVFFKIKQVSPRASVVQEEKLFWTKHFKVAKNYNTTVTPKSNLGKLLLDELADMKSPVTQEEERWMTNPRSPVHFDLPNKLFQRSVSAYEKSSQRGHAATISEGVELTERSTKGSASPVPFSRQNSSMENLQSQPVDLIAMFHDDELEPEGGDVSEDDACSDVVDIVM